MIIKNALYKSFLAIITYCFVYLLSNLAPVKDLFEDVAYDKIVANYLNLYEENFDSLKIEPIPKVDVFLIEDNYLSNYNLKDYGYVFPRKEMTRIIESINFSIEDMNVPPKIVFLDFDFHFTELPYGRELSYDDEKFIQELIKLSESTLVLIPKTKSFHFIEDFLEKRNLLNNNLLFVSPNFLVNSDLISRRFQSYYKENGKIYINADFVIYLINKNKCESLNEIRFVKEVNNEIELCGETLKSFDVVENRFIPKMYYKNVNNPYIHGYTLWDKESKTQNIRSVSTLIEESIIPKSLENSVIMIGGAFKGNNDEVTIAYDYAPSEVKQPGVILHLNTLNSLYFFNAKLKKINPILGLFIVFVIFFIFTYFQERYQKINDNSNINKHLSKLINLVFSTIMLSIIFILVSAIFLLYYKVWFNFFAPLLAYPIFDVIDKYIKKTR